MMARFKQIRCQTFNIRCFGSAEPASLTLRLGDLKPLNSRNS